MARVLPVSTLIVWSAPNVRGAEIVPAPEVVLPVPDIVTAVAPEMVPSASRSPVTVIPLVLVAMVISASPWLTLPTEILSASSVTAQAAEQELESNITYVPAPGK